jgi:ATP-dependent Lhr-like helicase
MVRAVRDGELDRVLIPDKPLDVLAQQIVAEAAAGEWDEDALFELVRRAYPYRGLEKTEFDEVVAMLAHGYAGRRGQRAALVHYDAVHRRLRERRGSRMIAIMSGGAIPEVFDYRVQLEPEGSFIGTLNEDFAIESLPGDIFQLGNTSWRILRIGNGVVQVADAKGQPPSMPFWLGEAPSRSDEMSAAVSRLRAAADAKLPGPDEPRRPDELAAAVAWLEDDYRLSRPAAEQVAAYLAEGKRALGVVPTADTLVLERFFDEAGGMQLVLHAPLGSRVNRAWGLALRKKFCQSFNFELQAAATEEALVLSLGTMHSFPLEEVFRYLNPKTVRETLVQAVLDSPIFQTRWRWVTTLALAVPRSRNGARLPAQIQRMIAEDLLAAVFPDAAACFENIQGAREIPRHPLVDQTIRDCLEQAMDLPRLVSCLQRVFGGEIRCVARDTPEPSAFCGEILNSAVYSFLDDAPLEERRTRAVYMRRATEVRSADDLGALDAAAIERVREEAWPEASTADELHDALLLAGFIRAEEAQAPWRALFDELLAAGRSVDAGGLWVSVERFDELNAVVPQIAIPAIPERLRKSWTPEDAARELVRGRTEVLGPVTARTLADSLGLSESGLIDSALLALEIEGKVLRGRFTPGASDLEWCDRRLLSRIHRYTLNRLRAEIEPVSAVDFTRFLLDWQHVTQETQLKGAEGVAAAIEQLEGFEVPAGAWEQEVLAARVQDYEPGFIDRLCLSGRVAWGRITPANGAARTPLRSSPIALMKREHAALWRGAGDAEALELGPDARAVHAVLSSRGASFFHEISSSTGLLRPQIERALGELAGAGLATADSFAGLRALLAPSDKHKRRARRHGAGSEVDSAGRWALLRGDGVAEEEKRVEARIENAARSLLARYGIVFRALLAREPRLPAWRDLAKVYRRLEARGEIRGGRFVSGFGGEQFALADAVGRLRAVRRMEKSGEFVAVCGADPLNLVGVLTPEARVAAIAANRLLFRDGLPVAALEGGKLRRLAASEQDDDALKKLFWKRGAALGFRTPVLSDASRKRWRERSVRVPLPG